jgi:1-deoxy-D-xylulose-5-phosphate synthase
VPVVLKNGGHLASNLGVVELTVALCYCFDFEEKDKIIWDVGHQSYVYKILTGRREAFHTLRQEGGLSGFPDPKESPADTFATGHASTAISAILGLAAARDLKGEDYNCVAVVGDGALTGGMTFEALNNTSKRKVLIVVNDNGMSIDGSVGKTVTAFSSLRIGSYDKNKQKFKNFLNKLPLLGKPLSKFFSFCKRVLKFGFINNNLYFNSFDVKYVGIADGHNMEKLVKYLNKIKRNVTQTTVMHVKTVKGKGHKNAEDNPSDFHGIPAEDDLKSLSMSKTAGNALIKLAGEGKEVAAITAAMKEGTGLTEFGEKFPQRLFDVGIAEQHAVTFSAGLCKGGVKPYFFVYSTFLQRGFDQIIHDVALQNLPVVFCIDRAGFAGSDGKTHQGLFDLSYLSLIPNLTVLAPADRSQLFDMIEWSYGYGKPLAIRYPKEAHSDLNQSFSKLFWNRILSQEGKVELIAVGNNMLNLCLEVADALNKEQVAANVTNACVIKPIDEKFLGALKNSLIFTFEENVAAGGLGASVKSYFCGKETKVYCFTAPDEFVSHASIGQQLKKCGFTVQKITQTILGLLKTNA